MKKPKIRFQISRGVNKEFFVAIIARNGRSVFWSGETYKRVASARKAIDGLLLAITEGRWVVEEVSKDKQ